MQASLEYKPDYQPMTDRRTEAIRAHVAQRVVNYPVSDIVERIDGLSLFHIYLAQTDVEAVSLLRRYLFAHRNEFPELVR